MKKFKVKNPKVLGISIGMVLIFVLVIMRTINELQSTKIERILKTEAYSYLPAEAKDYIKTVYENTGQIIFTEKNKEENTPYLNPEYIEYIVEPDEENYGEIPISLIVDYSSTESATLEDIPSSYDLRSSDEKGYVTPVRDQGDLGLCWTFATAGAAESYILKHNSDITLDNPLLISERQIDYLTARNGIKEYKSEYVAFLNRSLGDGGNFYISTIAMANGVSLVNYNSFKAYDDTDMSLMELEDVISHSKSQYEVNSTINFPRLSLRESTSILTEEETETRNSYLNEVKKNIIENGAAYVSTYMSSACQYVDANLDNTVIDIYGCSVSGGHAMQIIGWDDNIEYTYCADTNSHNSNTDGCSNVVSGKGVWILKNSWGDDLQYPYLTYDSLRTSIHFISDMTSTKNKTWDNNYVLGDTSDGLKEKTYSLENTKIKDNEILDKIKFISFTSDTMYEIKISKTDGSYKVISTNPEMPGLITVDVTEEIVVTKDTEIIISTEGEFVDRVSVFTSNVETDPYIDMEKYNNMSVSELKFRLYAETKNIPSGTSLEYKLYDSEDQEVTDKVTFTNNIVAENNVNTLVTFASDIEGGDYKISVRVGTATISSINIKVVKMQGAGTAADPYIITNPTQLSQIRNDLDAYYELGNDIDLSKDTQEGGKLSLASNACPQGFGWEAINGFSGTLDGKGHTIKGLYQNNYLECNIDGSGCREWNNAGNGLFGSAYGNVTIKNLVLEDFDINCQGGYCGVLLTKYDASNDSYEDKNEYTATFENIVLHNSDIGGKYNSNNNSNSSLKNSYGGGLFGTVESLYGNVIISNIHLSYNLKTPKSGLEHTAYLVGYLAGKSVEVNNIRVIGDYTETQNDYYSNSVLFYQIFVNDKFELKNVLSTVTGSNINGQLLGTVWGQTPENLIIDGVNLLEIPDRELFYRFDAKDAATIINTNIYNKDNDLSKLIDKVNYSTWENFENNWVMETVDGIPRLPVLKFVDFEYTSIEDISIKQKLNEHKNIYDYIKPNIDAAKRISFKSNNEEIVKISDDGTIIPQSTGRTTIHIESYYDGYIKDVPISIEYVPHYTIHFDTNDTEDYYQDIEGTMDSIEVDAGKSFILPDNKFTQEYYEFKEWNTKPDGTGISYTNLAEIPAMKDKEEITLYIQWWGKERVVTFDANGGTVSPDRKTVRIRQEYGELPIPTKDGYGFHCWVTDSLVVEAFNQLSGNQLKAFWEEDAYTIIYDANGGIIQEEYKHESAGINMSETISTTYAKNGEDKELYNNIYEKTDYKFKEWNTKADGSGTSYQENEIINLSNVDKSTLRLYAIWQSEKGTITFNANDGTNQTKTQEFIYGQDTDLDENSFTRAGYIFKSWNTKSDGSGDVYSDKLTINITEDLVLYAIWEEVEEIVINKYAVSEDNNYIDLIDVNTTVEEYKKNIVINSSYNIEVDYKTINEKNVIYTGGKTRIYKDDDLYKEYINIIRGDPSGDGKINYLDYVKVYNHIYKTKHSDSNKKLLANEYLLAADMSQDNKITYMDYVTIYNKIKKINGGNE